jgi:hypothetical protein
VLAIPLSLVAGFVVLSLFGATVNTMVLAGFVIAVGVVVDDAIIDVENITRRLRQYRREGRVTSTASVVMEGSTRRSSTPSCSCRSSSSAGSLAPSSSRWRSPTRWQCWRRWWLR